MTAMGSNGEGRSRSGETTAGGVPWSRHMLRIDGWIVDSTTSELRRGGEAVRLEPKVMDLLLYLADRPGVVVSRGQIEADVWEGLSVSYDSVTGGIAKLRKVFGDDARKPLVIETIPKKGYRLLAPVEKVPAAGEAAPSRSGAGQSPALRRRPMFSAVASSGMIAVGLIAAAAWYSTRDGAGEPKPIAVLPFKNLGAETNQDFFADGITEDIITDLSKVSGLFVIARDSAFAYKNKPVGVREAARDLGVQYVLEGSVRRADDTLRINVQLVDVESGGQLWAERYDREIADLLALQDEVARDVVSALAISLTSEEEEGLNDASRIDPEAYDLFLEGRTLLRLYSLNANADARDYFERAIALDPGFSRAHAALALSHAVDLTFGWSSEPKEARSLVKTHLAQALATGPDTAQMHFTQAMILGSERRIEEALQEFRKAIELDPNFADAHTTRGLFLSYAGKPEEAIKSIRLAMRLSPHHGYIYPYHLANAYFVMQDYDQAIPILEEVLERNPNFQQGRLLYISTLGLLGRIDDAEWETTEILTALPDFSIAEEEARVRFVQPEDRDRYIEGLKKAGLR